MSSALIIIDVQKGMFIKGAAVYKGEELISTLKTLIEKARSTDTPVFYVQHNAPAGKPLEVGKEGWEIHDEIKPRPGDPIIQKETPNSFLHTKLEEELNERGIKHIHIAGIQTEACVDTTCRSAFSKGYKVTLISDAHSTWDSGDLTAEQIIGHHNGVLRWFADVYPSEEIEFEQPAT
ncbi:cysteine hydrolase family protein [Rossellomorea oryzaecorticis]|uniref:Cysteine hydrolase family protein n=1 Tax=Rossellomorea oryzaecorticis TaxID=1396505 RepID=A0ABU9K7L8_9BACI